MLLHILMTLAYLLYIVYAPSPLYEDIHRNRVEVIAEMLNLAAVCTLAQFCRASEFTKSQLSAISIQYIVILALLVILIITYAVYARRVQKSADQRKKYLNELRESIWAAARNAHLERQRTTGQNAVLS